eukprot:gnl/Dysnectes_brevis/5466_a7877_333.p1 GENE.gnl/Dysnectes_brevis/5466_a7877_333~~gnl/Dysnectes_brevis/5466_a7877_333.p1  ORF type:complete len:512 (+),score=114.45 gnl/Dysnectes_brevis/5466_a7877_333:315-1850(+)
MLFGRYFLNAKSQLQCVKPSPATIHPLYRSSHAFVFWMNPSHQSSDILCVSTSRTFDLNSFFRVSYRHLPLTSSTLLKRVAHGLWPTHDGRFIFYDAAGSWIGSGETWAPLEIAGSAVFRPSRVSIAVSRSSTMLISDGMLFELGDQALYRCHPHLLTGDLEPMMNLRMEASGQQLPAFSFGDYDLLLSDGRLLQLLPHRCGEVRFRDMLPGCRSVTSAVPSGMQPPPPHSHLSVGLAHLSSYRDASWAMHPSVRMLCLFKDHDRIKVAPLNSSFLEHNCTVTSITEEGGPIRVSIAQLMEDASFRMHHSQISAAGDLVVSSSTQHAGHVVTVRFHQLMTTLAFAMPAESFFNAENERKARSHDFYQPPPGTDSSTFEFLPKASLGQLAGRAEGLWFARGSQNEYCLSAGVGEVPRHLLSSDYRPLEHADLASYLGAPLLVQYPGQSPQLASLSGIVPPRRGGDPDIVFLTCEGHVCRLSGQVGWPNWLGILKSREIASPHPLSSSSNHPA